LVNNAGTNPHFGPMLEASEAQFDKTFEVNLKGPFELIRLLANHWLEKEIKGVVVNVASIAGESAAPFQGIYGMTKAALISMTRTLALELGRRGVRINAIAPGLVDTKLSAALTQNPDLAKMFTDRTALGRYGQPEEIAELVVYLASDESRYVTGQTFNVDGGYSIA
jgi:NAD(P)-dependent dehydrogenase (short-subunit alcohol dehydrogenase family)